ncbi:SoxR reducing system RseC family protein [Shewanella sp. NIFS-20-20]|uniref:SoxR reducing system RseC family protein n=1 Tax=Shewanella sp. NIFS-20-20 TaxID=2853806 RepID=UPI001C47AFC4|nr:SoxR reducing system RseC family protein [Shewanella sp. NIFS-20-20]MBV7314232.1 SoxR reducing system RseC family protein [Shewanella sp. NIFS-20-20]
MMEQLAKVIDCRDPHWPLIEVTMTSACNHCDSGESCGTQAVSKAFSPKVQRFFVHSERACQLGDVLKIGVAESVILKAAALVYLLPLLGLFVGALVGQWLTGVTSVSGQGMVMAIAAVGALIAWRVAKRWAVRLEANAQPQVMANLGQPLLMSPG